MAVCGHCAQPLSQSQNFDEQPTGMYCWPANLWAWLSIWTSTLVDCYLCILTRLLFSWINLCLFSGIFLGLFACLCLVMLSLLTLLSLVQILDLILALTYILTTRYLPLAGLFLSCLSAPSVSGYKLFTLYKVKGENLLLDSSTRVATSFPDCGSTIAWQIISNLITLIFIAQ